MNLKRRNVIITAALWPPSWPYSKPCLVRSTRLSIPDSGCSYWPDSGVDQASGWAAQAGFPLPPDMYWGVKWTLGSQWRKITVIPNASDHQAQLWETGPGFQPSFSSQQRRSSTLTPEAGTIQRKMCTQDDTNVMQYCAPSTWRKINWGCLAEGSV